MTGGAPRGAAHSSGSCYARRVGEEALSDPQVFGGYVLLQALGRGAMGDVFLARPRDPRRGIPTPVVVKRLHGELAKKPGFVARFKHEAAIAVSVTSPHVAKVYDVGAVGETLYIAMEFVPGWALSKVLDAVLRSGRHASVASVVDLVAGGLEGLGALHTARDPKTGQALEIVHRDLSPKNLMVGEDGRMRIIDLGLGKSNAQDWRTRTGVVMGSVGYMPPEQARGERVDARADVYAMGVVAFEMLALRNYIKRGSLPEMMDASARPVFVRPSEFRPDVPRELDRVIERALEPDRERRYASAAELLAALRAVVPRAYTDGGMVTLLTELFGEARQLRDAELRRLLALPDPDDFETRPTRVYVTRDGVAPLDERSTQRVEVIGGSMDERTALTEVSGPRWGSTTPASTAPHVVTAHSLAPAVGRPRGKGGISLGILLGAVLAAALLGGVVAVVVVLAVLKPEAPTITQAVLQEEAPPPAPVVTERPAAPPPPLAPAPAEVPERVARRPRLPAPESTRVAPAPPPPTAPERPTLSSLDADLDRLEAQARRLKNASEVAPAVKDEALKVLIDISMWRRSEDLERKGQAVLELREKLRTLR